MNRTVKPTLSKTVPQQVRNRVGVQASTRTALIRRETAGSRLHSRRKVNAIAL